MKTLLFILVILLFSFISGPSKAGDLARATMFDVAGQRIGLARFEQTDVGVLITVEIGSISPGVHAIHLHSVGTCSPNFKAAGGHINPAKVAHGIKNVEGPDNGDLPNIFVDPNGHTAVQFLTTWVTVKSGSVSLLDRNGSTLVIHAKGDDHLSQPIGGAGDRIACGVISPL